MLLLLTLELGLGLLAHLASTTGGLDANVQDLTYGKIPVLLCSYVIGYLSILTC